MKDSHKESAKLRAAVMLAYADGKEIEWRDIRKGAWQDAPNPTWNWDKFEYRVKPEEDPRLRHEAMDRASVMIEVFESSIVNHPFFESDAGCELRGGVMKIGHDLAELYQRLAAPALGEKSRQQNAKVVEADDFLMELMNVKGLLAKNTNPDLAHAIQIMRELRKHPLFKKHEDLYKRLISERLRGFSLQDCPGAACDGDCNDTSCDADK